jgi:hypothetical protein
MMRCYCNSVATIYQQSAMKNPLTTPPARPVHSHPAPSAGSLLLQSALLRGLGAFALCAALATVLVWATRPMA